MVDNSVALIVGGQQEQDLEKASLRSLDKASSTPHASLPEDIPKSQSKISYLFQKVTYFLTRYGVETSGYVVLCFKLFSCLDITSIWLSIDPIPPESRSHTQMFQMFFVWFSSNMNVLGYLAFD
jgi:hypothetical protein